VRGSEGIDPRQTVWVMQEKGSDAAMVTHLLMDALDNRLDAALVITNDSEFVEPIIRVRDRLGRRVVVISPDQVVAKKLARAASHARPLDQRRLAAWQRPDETIGGDGHLARRPPAWQVDPTHS
jgi:uncharacterized LabA/DUF88 family protein